MSTKLESQFPKLMFKELEQQYHEFYSFFLLTMGLESICSQFSPGILGPPFLEEISFCSYDLS